MPDKAGKSGFRIEDLGISSAAAVNIEASRLNTVSAPNSIPNPESRILSGTFLAFDFGSKRIGIAVGNSLTGTARPLSTINDEKNEVRFAAIAALLKEWQPVALVVGLPCNDDGTPHEMTALCRRFANRLKGRFDLPTILVDERYTSAAASSALDEEGIHGRKQKSLIDQYAAQQILQAYFDEPSAGIYA